MILKRYQNELIVLGAFLMMLFAYMYKHNHVESQVIGTTKLQNSINELKEAVALKKIWADKNIKKKIISLEMIIPSSKVVWVKKKQKVTASYKGLSASELNKLTSQILNLPIEILLLDINKIDTLYNVEFKCKW